MINRIILRIKNLEKFRGTMIIAFCLTALIVVITVSKVLPNVFAISSVENTFNLGLIFAFIAGGGVSLLGWQYDRWLNKVIEAERKRRIDGKDEY